MQPSPRASELSYPCPICADCSREQHKRQWSFAETYLRHWAFVETSQEFCWKLFFKVLETIVLHISDILTIASKVETGSCSDIVPLPAAGDGILMLVTSRQYLLALLVLANSNFCFLTHFLFLRPVLFSIFYEIWEITPEKMSVFRIVNRLLIFFFNGPCVPFSHCLWHFFIAKYCN